MKKEWRQFFKRDHLSKRQPKGSVRLLEDRSNDKRRGKKWGKPYRRTEDSTVEEGLDNENR